MARPLDFTDSDDLQVQIDSYFDGLVGNATISGLCYYLGFDSRQSFYDYEKREEFSYTIKRARLRIEMAYEDRLHSSTPAGAIFALKNFGWSDKTEVEHSGSIGVRESIRDSLPDYVD